MTIAQFIVVYAVCWWLVLFMVLPSGVSTVKNPQAGHAPSAPADPRLKRKFGITSLWAILPTVLIYLIATTARAEDTIYHVGGGCAPLAAYQAPEDISVRDGYGAGGKKLVGANLESSTILGGMDHVDIPLRIPAGNYLDADKYNVDLAESNADIGTIRVGKDGLSLLNGQSISGERTYPKGCGESHDK